MKCQINIKTNKEINPEKLKQFGELEVDNNILTLTIENNELTATRILNRVNKLLRELAKEKKTKIEEFKINNYHIEFELNKPAKELFQVPFANLKLDQTRAILEYNNLDVQFTQDHIVERTINLVKEKVEKQYFDGKAETWNEISPAKDRPIFWDKDPTEEMLKLGWIKNGPTKGKWILGPEFTQIVKAMENIVINEILKPLEFKQIMATNLINEEIWLKTGHLVGMPMELYYVREPATRNPKAWEHLTDEIKVTKKVPHDKFDLMLKKGPVYGLTYAQCPVMYWFFQNKTFKQHTLPIKIFDTTQNTFRYECGGRHGLERVDEFHRVEPVYLGTPEQMVELRNNLFELYTDVFDNILEITWRAAEVTPFFLQHAGEENNNLAKNIGTIDFEAILPYKDKKNWLEFQNLTIVGDKYAKAFNIKAQKTELWTGCTGIGLERWAIVFLAQKGLNPKNWPDAFKKYLPEIKKGFEFC